MNFGGWLLAALWAASRDCLVRCVQCHTLYFIETRGARIADILLWIFILLILFGILADFLEQR